MSDQLHQYHHQQQQQMHNHPFPLNPMFPTSNNIPPSSSMTGETPRKAYRPPALRTQGHLPTRSLEELSDASGDEGEVGSALGSGFSAGYRRARAGTLPSTLDAPFSGDRYGLTNATTPTAPTHQRDLSLGPSDLITRSGGTTPIEPLERQRQFQYARPGLRHSNSSAAALTGSGSLSLGGQQDSLQGAPGLLDDGFPSDAQGRLRSGSLTRPDKAVGTVSDAFGSGFSNTWLQNPAGRSSMNQVTTARGGASGRGGALHQVTSRESSFSSGNSSGGGEDNYQISQSTVDYLGLADNMETPRAATFGFQSGPAPPVPNNGSSGLGLPRGAAGGSSQDLQMTPTAATMVARNRASTVSVQPKSSASFQDLISAANLGLDRDPTRPVGLFDGAQRNSAANLRAGIEGMEYLESGGNTGNRDPYGSSAPHFGMGSSAQLRGYKDDGLSGSARPRATTISMLDQPSARLGNVGMHGSELMDSLIAPSAPTPPPMGMGSGLISANQGGRRSALGNDDQARRRDRGEGARAGPGGASGDGMAAGQTPTRSIWLGNLDVMTTAQDLLQVFQGYGDIESLRLLPEKSCAFVNFIDRNDAIRAKEDVQLRMHNLIPTLSDTPIRIGFGKIDSVPTAQPSASTQQYSLSNSSASSLASQSDVESDADSVAGDNMESSRINESNSPTRALWIGSIPSYITSNTLVSIFSAFGNIESARMLPAKQCGFVNFESLDAATSARNALNGREFLGADIGPIRVGYARAPSSGQHGQDGSPSPNNFPSVFQSQRSEDPATHRPAGTAPMTQENVSHIESYGNDLVRDLINKGSPNPNRDVGPPAQTPPPHPPADVAAEGDVNEQQMLMTVLSHGDANLAADVQAVGKHSEKSALYYSYIPVVPDRSHYRKFDTVALKDIRRRLDGGYCAPEEVDQVAQDLMEDCVVLSSDYIGNTIIQKLYASTTTSIRMEMLRRIAPHLALTGTHKNGTWAAQKIIECATSEEEMSIISRNLSPYVPPLSADSYGNYLVSACLKFPSPFNGFVYDAMVDRTWDIAQTRYGARCMRTCLESPHTSFFQKKRLASAIILHSIPLATNPNGALLLTWLMDANELPGRYGLLATRLASFVQHLATHKLASLTILRLVNQKNEPDAAKTMIDAIFRSANDQTLREILQDQVHGVHAVSKMVCSDAIIPPDEKPEILAAVKRVLEDMRNVSGLNYKRLLEECGLPVPAAPSGGPRYQGGRREGNHRHREQSSNSLYNGSIGTNPNYRGRGYNNGSNNVGNPGPSMSGFDSYGMMPDINQMMSSMQAFQLGQGMTGSLSPLIANQHSFGQVMNPGLPPLSPTPTLGSFATPHAQLMSPNSDPFNPFASPSQLPRNPNAPVRYPTPIRRSPAGFDLSPTLGGLGMQPANRDDLHRSTFPGFAPT